MSGVSGAGKSEASKLLLGYLSNASRDFRFMNVDFSMPLQNRVEDEIEWSKDKRSEKQKSIDALIERRILESNLLLEVFGNAKTQSNANSSRFGKRIMVKYNEFGKIHS